MKEFDLVIRNGTVVTSMGMFHGDVAVRGGRIASLGEVVGEARETFDATALHVLPGLVDVHVHFREPGMTEKEDFVSGSRSAAAGGVTTVFDMPNTIPPVTTAEWFLAKRESVSSKSYADFALYGMIGYDNEDELGRMHSSGAIGFKLFMGETTGRNPCPPDDVLYGAFRQVAAINSVIGIHGENDPILQRLKRELQDAGRRDPRAHLDSRPPLVEREAISRAAILAEATGAQLHVHHVSTRAGLDEVRRARRRGTRITCEVLVAHLLLDSESYDRCGNLVKLNPPVRDRVEVDSLWQGLLEGDIDCIASDHAPHTREEQMRENVWDAPGGFIGVETMLPLLLTAASKEELSLDLLVKLTSTNPAKIYGLYPRKGSLLIGSDADFVIVDRTRRSTIRAEDLHSRHSISPYEGWPTVGIPIATFLRGKCIAFDGKVMEPPHGEYIRRRREEVRP